MTLACLSVRPHRYRRFGLDVSKQQAGSRGGVTGYGSHALFSAQSFEIGVKDFVDRRCGACGSYREDGRRQGNIAVDRVYVRRRPWLRVAAMAGPTRYERQSAEILVVDPIHHVNHGARSPLCGRIVRPIRVICGGPGMTIAAAIAQGGRKQAHRPHEFVDGHSVQDRNVFECIPGHHLTREQLSLRRARCEDGTFEWHEGAVPRPLTLLIHRTA